MTNWHTTEEAQNFIDTGDSRGTSPRVMRAHRALRRLAGGRAMISRYLVAPIASPECDAIDEAHPILWTISIAVAREAAAHHSGVYGAGIIDTVTGLLDVGYGFGVCCPEEEGDVS